MLKYFIAIYFVLSLNLYADIVKKINISGNSRISSETIKVYGDINLGKDYSNFGIDKILKSLYATNFFEDIQISLIDGTLSISVKEYVIISSVDFRGEKSNQVKKKFLKH